jgi:hypothetical protein
MAEFTLLLIEAVEIQHYIFASNVLRENVSASDLVRCATRIWPLEAARDCCPGRSNVQAGDLTGTTSDLGLDKHIEDKAIDLEVLYAWGGSIAVLCQPDVTRKYLSRFSRRVLEEAPGLELAAVQVVFDWADSLTAKMEEARNLMAFAKRSRSASAPLLGLGPTLACQSTGLPVVSLDGDRLEPRPLSASVLAKLQHLDAANAYLKSVLPAFGDAGLEIPYDFDQLGRSAGEMSYIAVVHADGNHMGSKIDRLREKYASPGQNRDYISAMRAYTQALDDTARQALLKMSATLVAHHHADEKADWIVGEYREGGQPLFLHDRAVPLSHEKDGPTYIPFRPIAFGGDDFTFVSDGRLGLALATIYLKAFETFARQNAYLNHSENDYLWKEGGFTASAGVAVVKTHYPFARAYDLADDLCRSAKERGAHQRSALDWHFAAAGLFGELKDIRQRQYFAPDLARPGYLTMRPVLIDQAAGDWRTWLAFVQVVQEFQTGNDWEAKRNKVLALRQALRGGEQAVTHFRTRYELQELPPLWNGDVATWRQTGWVAEPKRTPDDPDYQRCVYFDAVEALDFFVPLYDNQEASHD